MKDVILHYVTKLLMPTSPAYGNTIPFAKNDLSIFPELEIGDIIFTKTNNSIYQMARDYLHTDYDHVTVVISPTDVIHISPPITSKLPLKSILQAEREPLILRAGVESRETLVSILTGFLGEKYNQKAVFQIFKNELKKRLNFQQHHDFSLQAIKYSKICTDTILYAFCRSDARMRDSIQEFAKNSSYSAIGFMLPSELSDFFQRNGATILYKSPAKSQHTIIDFIKLLNTRFKKNQSLIRMLINVRKLVTLPIMLTPASNAYKLLLVIYLLIKFSPQTQDKLQSYIRYILSFVMVVRPVEPDHHQPAAKL